MSHNHRDTRNEADRLDLLRSEVPTACTDERKAVEFFERQRWGETPACPRCGDTDVYQLVDRTTGERNRRYLWKCNGCEEQYTVRIGTVMEHSRIPLRHWAYAFWSACASKKGVSALQIRRQTRVSYKSALFMMHRIRYAMAVTAPQPKLTGVVEADETFFGGKRRNKTRDQWLKVHAARQASGLSVQPQGYHGKPPIFAVVQRGGDVRATVVPDVTARSLKAAIRECVDPSATIYTDEHASYQGLGKEFAAHDTVKHSMNEYARGPVSTNSVEGFFGLMKRALIGTFHSVSKKHLHRYVSEFEFKFNTRKLDDGERLVAALRGAEGKRLLYREPIEAPA